MSLGLVTAGERAHNITCKNDESITLQSSDDHIDKVMTGEVDVQDLVVSKLLRQDVDKYRSLFPHVSAAIQLREAGKSLVRRENIQFVYVDAQHKNPLCRVTPVGLIKQRKD